MPDVTQRILDQLANHPACDPPAEFMREVRNIRLRRQFRWMSLGAIAASILVAFALPHLRGPAGFPDRPSARPQFPVSMTGGVGLREAALDGLSIPLSGESSDWPTSERIRVKDLTSWLSTPEFHTTP